MRFQRILTSALAPAAMFCFVACAQEGTGSGTGGSSGTGTGGSSTGTGGSGTGGNGTGTGGTGTGTGGKGTGGSGTGGLVGTGGSGTGGLTGTGGSGTGGAGTAAHTGGVGGGAAGAGAGGKGGAGTGGGTGGVTATGGAGGGSSGAVYNPNFVEFYGSDCTVATPKDVSISGQLPNLFTKLDGTTMAKQSDWKCRRAEMKAVVEKYIFGAKPGAPDMVTGSVTSYHNQGARRTGQQEHRLQRAVSVPSGAKGPVPIIIGLTGSSLSPSIVSAEGVATGTYDIQGMMSESSRTGLFTTLYGTSTGVSSQIGWAWGFSRVIDVLISEKAAGRNNIIDPTAVGVTGCSRDGKGAFTVGAFDERIALGIPQESGTGRRVGDANREHPAQGAERESGSVALQRREHGGGMVRKHLREHVHQQGGHDPGRHALPRRHARPARIAGPRQLADWRAVRDLPARGDRCCPGRVPGARPRGERGYNGGNPGDPQNHCTFYPDTQGPPLQRAIRAHLTKTAAPDGRMEPQPAGTADLTKWVPWSSSAPTLTNDVSWSSPPVASQ